MDHEDSPPAEKEDPVSAQDRPRESVTASNEAGPSGTQQPPKRNSKKLQRRGSHSQDDLSDEGSEMDSDLEGDCAHYESPDDHQTSHVLENGQRLTSMTKPKSSSRRKGGRRREKMSIEEMIKKQETASQTHNENERFRRKELRGALLGLRNQLRTPTKRPAVKLVLEAAIKELRELKKTDDRNAKLVETLKDKERRLTLELESKKKEYEKHRENGPSSSSSTTPIIVSPSVLPAGVAPVPGVNWPFPPIYNPTLVRPDSATAGISPVPFNPWTLTRPVPQTLSSPTLNFGMPTVFNGFTSVPQFPVLNGSPQFRIPGIIPPLHPFQTAAAFASPLAPSAYAAAFSPRVTMPVMPPGVTSSSGSPLVLSRPPEPQRVPTIVTPQNNREGIGSKNDGESAERPTSVQQCINSADSDVRPAKRMRPFSIDSLGISEEKRQLIEEPNLESAELEVVKHTPSTTIRPSPPPYRSKRRLQRKAPPLLKIDDEHLLRFNAVAEENEANDPMKIHANSETIIHRNTDLVTVQKYDNPFYNRNPRFQQSPRRWNTSHTDSDSSEEDVQCSPNRLSTFYTIRHTGN